MSVHGIDMYITKYVHTVNMSVRVYDMFVNLRFGTDFRNAGMAATMASDMDGIGLQGRNLSFCK